MRALPVLLFRHCPVCGGRCAAEGQLPLSQGMRAMELNLDEPARLVETLSLHLLLALIELLPYKQFVCRRCGHEFRLASQTTREMLYGMLTSMRPVTAPPPPSTRPVNSPVAGPKPRRPAGKAASESPAAARTRAAKRPAAEVPRPAEEKEVPPDWTPYHLDSDMDTLFDQFKEE